MEHGSDGGSLEMAEGPEIFEGLLTTQVREVQVCSLYLQMTFN